MKRRAPLALLAAAALIALGCGGSGSGERGEASRPPSSVATTTAIAARERPAGTDPASRGVRLEVVDSRFGRVVADRHGEALYLFDREDGRRSGCYGACARAWPPLLTKGTPVADGVDQGLLGTTRRSDGRLQVTYAGHPLYYYVGDSPGTILCHEVVEFGGTWLVVMPDGRPAA